MVGSVVALVSPGFVVGLVVSCPGKVVGAIVVNSVPVV